MSKNLADYRKNYDKGELLEEHIAINPFVQFKDWFEEMEKAETSSEVNAMNISSIGLDGFPKNRIVILKEYNEDGFVFYTNDFITQGDADSWLTIMVPIIITGMFMMHYGQFFLSWNASYIDFFLAKNGGIEELVKGKYIIIVSVSLVLYLLSLGYVYLWDQVLLLHTAMFLFNIGINIHLVIMLALWEPKPMDLDRSAMFNYEGVGLAQFLLAIPMIGAPYGIYFSAQYLVGSYGAIIVLGLVGVMGVLLSPKILQYHANRIIKKRYQISASFRQET
jgi:hypothetical protein